jgi:hypothetical protein
MNRTLASMVLAVLAAALWLLWNFEHEDTSIRAPWTGLTYVASAVAFMAVGLVGRGWRAVVVAVAAAAAAVVLVDPLVWHSEPSDPALEESCDPGCISLEAAVGFGGGAAAALAALGIVLRRALRLARRARASAAA